MILQRYNYSQMRYYDPPIIYKSWDPGPLLLAASGHYNQEIAVSSSDYYRYIAGLSGAYEITNWTLDTVYYVSETNWIRRTNTLVHFMTDNGYVYNSVQVQWNNFTNYQAGDKIYFYVDTIGYFPDYQRPTDRAYLICVHANPGPDDPVAHINCAYSAYNPSQYKSWLRGVSNTAKIPTDQTTLDDGDWDGSSDDVGIPGLPSIDAINSGLLRGYKCDAAQINALATELWSPGFLSTIEQYFNSPAEALISVGILPFSPSSAVAASLMKIGNYTCSTASGHVLSSQWYKLNCGSFTLSEFYGSYLDYQSNVSIFLPYIGSRELNVEDVMGAKLELEYHVDVISGSLVAMLQCTKNTNKGHQLNSVLYEWSGSCRMELPLSSTNAAQKAAGLASAVVQTAVGVGTAVATGGAGAAIGAGIIASGLSTAAQSQQTHYNRCGGITADSALMGIQTPYIAVMRPRMTIPSQYYTVRGGQTYISGANANKSLRALTGMTVCEKILVDGLNATQEERDELQTLAREGIIL